MAWSRRLISAAFLSSAISVLALVAVPQFAQAIQLHWKSGSSDLSFASATRCTLVVQADSTEVRLPGSWRLQWTADSSGIRFVALDSLAACLTDTAKVSSIDQPGTAADSAANQIIEHFCSVGNAAAAYNTVDLIGGSKGKLKAVALDPADSSRVIESNEVTYNGGIEGSYSPLILRASSVHQSLQLLVTVVGSDLNTAGSMSIMATDSSWTLPLTVSAQSERSLTGVAAVAALLPACRTSVGSASGAVSAASLPADVDPAPDSPLSCQAQYFEQLLSPPPSSHGYTIQPKDFAFTRGFVDATSNRYALHLFYIRHNYWYDALPRQDDLNEKNIGQLDDRFQFMAWPDVTG